MYAGAISSVRFIEGETDTSLITIGLYQGYDLSPYLFALVKDDISRHISDEVSWCILFTEDIILIDKTRAEINYILELWMRC